MKSTKPQEVHYSLMDRKLSKIYLIHIKCQTFVGNLSKSILKKKLKDYLISTYIEKHA